MSFVFGWHWHVVFPVVQTQPLLDWWLVSMVCSCCSSLLFLFAMQTEAEYEKEKLNERIARLSGGVAVIQVCLGCCLFIGGLVVQSGSLMWLCWIYQRLFLCYSPHPNTMFCRLVHRPRLS